MIDNLRILTSFEQDIITRALEYYVNMPLVPRSFQWGASAMLEQNMPQHLFWATEKELDNVRKS